MPDKDTIRLLIVEDDEEDHLLTSRLLRGSERARFEIKWARTYDAALDELSNPHEIWLVDYRLGARNGLELIETAIQRGFAGPLILLTGRGDHAVDVDAMRRGAADYLVKDQLTPQLIERVIRHAIERKKVEGALLRSEEQLRQSQKMEAVGNLAGGVAHDFNNLLSIILSYSELLAQALPATDPMRDDLEQINAAGLRAADLTRQLLAFSRQQVLQPTALDLNLLFGGVEKMLRRMLGEDIELVAVSAPNPSPIMADPGQIERVILNLAMNARDAMPRGGKLTIEVSNVILDEGHGLRQMGEKPRRHVLLAVSDTGTGMDKATAARVFEPFFTTKEVGKGTGLGLATVFGIVQQSGATISVNTELSVGTTFKVHFPALDRMAALPASVPPLERRGLRGTETVLVVEDEASVRTLVRTILHSYGYEVLESQGAGDAFFLCEQRTQPIDLLLTDVVMPRMGGRELAERLLVVHPEMKVLYMSGYTNDAVVRHGIIDSTIAFLHKPITPEALARKVREVLDAAPRLAN